MSIAKRRRKEILEFKDKNSSDILEMTDDQLSELHASHLRNPDNYRPVKKKICMYIDTDILEWYKADGKRGYQTKINQVLRQNMLHEASPVYGKGKNTPDEEKG